MQTLIPAAAIGLALAAPAARADVVWEWNDAALAATVDARQPPFVATRAMAILDVAEIRALGGKASAVRSAAQTEAARFWAMTGPTAQWPVAKALTSSSGRTLVQDARTLALLSIPIEMTSATTPGTTHRGVEVRAWQAEVSNARV